MAATPEIRVFALFPHGTDWNWIHCLTFPLDTLDKLHFTPRPLKWIRYATGVVVGVQGDLSSSRDASNAMDYDIVPSDSADLFYHTSDAEKQRMFPADPDVERTSIITSSDASESPSRVQLHKNVAARDQACVLNPFFKPFDCDAVHLVPHSQGNVYIEAYTRHRSRDSAQNDVVTDIDDVRNCVFLNSVAHRHLGTDMAFLLTPNFSMDTADVDPNASPSETRCTAHLFSPDRPSSFGHPDVRSGSPVRMPDVTDAWPPTMLFDAVYANAVIGLFASEALQDTLREWKSTFPLDERAVQNECERRATPQDQHTNHLCVRYNRDVFDMLLMPYMLAQSDQVNAYLEKRAEKEWTRVVDKVVDWAVNVADVQAAWSE